MDDRTLIAIAHEIAKATDDELARYDTEGARILARELQRLAHDIDQAATRLSNQIPDEGIHHRTYH